MKVELSELAGVRLIKPHVFEDERGAIVKDIDCAAFLDGNVAPVWRQHIVSKTTSPNTLRGLHAQRPPYTEAKLITSVAGQMFWVIVDLRRAYGQFGNWGAAVLDGKDPTSLYVPRGFAHGCLSLSSDVTLTILADNDYHPNSGVGIAWDDPDLAIAWPLFAGDPLKMTDEHANCIGFTEQIEGFKGF